VNRVRDESLPDGDRLDATADRAFDLVFALYVFFGQGALTGAIDALTKGATTTIVRWVGALFLIAFALEPVGLALVVPRTVRVRPDSRWFGPMVVYLALARFVVGLMFVILGCTGIGLEVRDSPSPVVVVALLSIAALREVTVGRLLVQRAGRAAARLPPRVTFALGRACLFPGFVMAYALIERGLLRDVFGVVPPGFVGATIAERVGWSFIGVVAIGLLYLILLFAPLRMPKFVPELRDGRVRGAATSFALGLAAVAAKLIVPWWHG